jgi:hypothetical protein
MPDRDRSTARSLDDLTPQTHPAIDVHGSITAQYHAEILETTTGASDTFTVREAAAGG